MEQKMKPFFIISRIIIIVLVLISIFFIYLTARLVDTKVYWLTFYSYVLLGITAIFSQISLFIEEKKNERI